MNTQLAANEHPDSESARRQPSPTRVSPDLGLCAAGRGAASRIAARLRSESGAATAEYAVATMAAVGFAGLLVVILRGDEVRGILTELIRRALSVG